MKNNNIYKEEELLTLVAAGNQPAFTQLVAHYTPIIYRHLLLYGKDAAQAEEVTQDILLTIWNNRQKLSGMENFAGYVYVITRNRANLIFRQKLKAISKPPDDLLQQYFEEAPADLELKELYEIVNRGIELLPPKRREVFKLSRFEHLSYEEIAARLSITRSTVRQHIIASLFFLRTYLKEEGGIIMSTLFWLAVLQH